MSDRDVGMQTFLSASGWDSANVVLLAGDASNRRYFRLNRAYSGESAVLMDAPPEKNEDVRPFIRIAEYLSSIGLSSPRILARDVKQGFLLLEDLGDALFARVIPEDPTLEIPLYEVATDVLIDLHRHNPPPGLSLYDAPVATDLSALVFDWYAPMKQDARLDLVMILSDALATHAPECTVLIQRDYHAENLLWLPNRKGLARVGLLDFQDAALGHPAYDLVSLLQDARRDVSPQIEAQMIDRYTQTVGQDRAAFQAAYAVVGAQRNLRIIGVFARLCIRDGKPQYLDLIPRVWGVLQRDLAHPALASLKSFLCDTIPAPTPQFLEEIKKKCP